MWLGGWIAVGIGGLCFALGMWRFVAGLLDLWWIRKRVEEKVGKRLTPPELRLKEAAEKVAPEIAERIDWRRVWQGLRGVRLPSFPTPEELEWVAEQDIALARDRATMRFALAAALLALSSIAVTVGGTLISIGGEL